MTEINKYNTAMIYSIRSPATEKYYIGSTTQILCKRFGDHKTKYKGYLKNIYKFVTSFKILELGDAYIELLEEFSCDNKLQLEKREGELIREHKNNCVNKKIEGRTDKEYRVDNVEKLKTYRREHVESKKKYDKQYKCNNKEILTENSKKYRDVNKEKIAENKKLYYIFTKEQRNKKCQCVCGATINHNSKAKHIKSAKHLKALEQEIIIV